MMPQGGNGKTYRLVTSGVVREALKQLLIAASEAGFAEEVIRAVKIIRQRLIHDPLGLGEPLYNLPNLKLEVRLGIVSPLAVQYAVHQEQPLIFLKSFTLLSASGL